MEDTLPENTAIPFLYIPAECSFELSLPESEMCKLYDDHSSHANNARMAMTRNAQANSVAVSATNFNIPMFCFSGARIEANRPKDNRPAHSRKPSSHRHRKSVKAHSHEI